MMSAQIEHHHAPLGLFGGFKLKEGRVDLKLGGLIPITCGARAMALKLASLATSSAGRLAAVRDAGTLVQEDMDNLREAHQTVTRIILDQQIADIEAGREPGPRVDPRRLSRSMQAKLKQALKTLEGLPLMTKDVVTSSRRG
jgi:signal-transduction protein with cAMP-binding, CBS, and nucleotidyltransferase domain